MFRFIFFVGIALALVSTGHAAVTIQASKAEQRLESWIDYNLAPDVIAQLKQTNLDPNLPLLLVVMKDGQIQPRVNKLHAFVQQRLHERLLKSDHVYAVSRTQHLIPFHHRIPTALSCDPHNGVRAYLAFEIIPKSAGLLTVKFRLIGANDLTQSQDYFEHSSKVKKWHYSSIQWREVDEDEGLRGLRFLPFTTNQPDLMAQYLARNLSCLIRSRIDKSIRLYVDAKSLTSPLNTVVANLRDYLVDLNEVSIHRSIEQANFVVKVDEYLVDDKQQLYQISTNVVDLQNDEILGGVTTRSYMSMLPQSLPSSQLQSAVVFKSKPAAPTQSSVVVEPDSGNLNIDCLRYVDGGVCNGPFERRMNHWFVKLSAGQQYAGTAVVARMRDHQGDNFKAITGRCVLSSKGDCHIILRSDAGLYKGNFVVEASLNQDDSRFEFEQVFYTK